MAPSSRPRWRDLRLGLFFIASSVVLLTSLFIVGTNQHLFRRKYDLHLRLENAQGLATGAKVSLSGLEVGRVTGITFAESDTLQILALILSVERRYQDRITGSSIATVRTVGVLGDKFIDISLGKPGEPPLRDGGEIPVRGSIDWAATFERGVGAMDDMIALVKQASIAMQEVNEGEGAIGVLLRDPDTGADLRALADNLNAVTRELRTGEGTFGRLLRSTETADQLDSVLTQLDRLGTEAREGSGLVAKLLGDDEFAGRVDRLVSRSDSLITAIRTQGTTGRLIADESVYDELRTSLAELRTLVEDIRANPERYVRVSIF